MVMEGELTWGGEHIIFKKKESISQFIVFLNMGEKDV